MIYMLLLFSLYFVAVSPPLSNNFIKARSFWLSVTILTLLFAFIPATQYGVGTDFFSYLKIFNDDYYLYVLLNKGELGTFVLFRIAQLFEEPRFLFFLYAVLTSLFFSIYLVSANYIFKINQLFLVCAAFVIQSNLYHIQLSAIRQALSVSLSSLYLLYLPLPLSPLLKLIFAFLACITHNTGTVPVAVCTLIYLFARHIGKFSPLFLKLFPRFNISSLTQHFGSVVPRSMILTIGMCFIFFLLFTYILVQVSSLLPFLSSQAWKYSTYYSQMVPDPSSAVRRLIYLPFILYFFAPNKSVKRLFQGFTSLQLSYYFSLIALAYLCTFASALNPAFYRLSHMFVIFTILPTSIALKYDSKNVFLIIPTLIAIAFYLIKIYRGVEVFGYTPFF